MLRRTAQDIDTIPQSLLDAAREQIRLDHHRDDPIVRSLLQRAISEVEHVASQDILAATWEWQTQCEQRLPVAPVRKVYTLDEQQGEVLVTFCQYNNEFYLTEKPDAGVSYFIETGFETASEIDLKFLSPILMLTASLYENRESVQMGGMLREMPDESNRILAGVWRPSV